MSVASRSGALADLHRDEVLEETHYEKWHHWPVNWSAVWVGALTAVTVALLFGLIGIVIGAHVQTPEHRIVDLRKLGFGSLAFSVVSAFLTFAGAGWVAARVAGIRRSEPAILHAVIAWLVAVPVLVLVAALGAGSSLGAWHAGLVGSNAHDTNGPFERPAPLAIDATEPERIQYRTDQDRYASEVKQWRNDSPKVARNTALGAVSALLLGLMGSLLGGWLASGEPMTFNHHRLRKPGMGRI